jgi:hypothetical protein
MAMRCGLVQFGVIVWGRKGKREGWLILCLKQKLKI